MIEDFKRLSGQTLIYGLGDAIIKAIAFFLIPLYTKVLTKEQVGTIALLNYLELLLQLLLTLSFTSAVFKIYHDYEQESERNAVFSTAIIFTGAIAVLVLTIFFFNAPLISQIIFGSKNEAIYLKLIFGSVLFNLFRQFALSYARTIEQPIFYSILNIVHFLLLVGLNVYFILFRGEAILGVVKSSFITSVGIFIIFATIVLRKIGYSFSKPILTGLLHFGLPMAPGIITTFVLNLSDRYLLNWFATASEVGLYDIAYKFGMIMNMLLVMPLRTAWLPFVYSIQKKPDASKIYSGAVTYFLLLATLLFLVLVFFVKEIIIIFTTNAYLPGAPAVPLIALAYIFYGLYSLVDIGILLKAKTIYYTVISSVGAIVSVGLNIILIPGYGMMAAAINAAFAYFLVFVLMYFVSRKFYEINYEWKRISKIILIGAILFMLNKILSFNSLILSMAIKILLICCYPVLLWLVKFFRPTELAGYRKIILDLFNQGRR